MPSLNTNANGIKMTGIISHMPCQPHFLLSQKQISSGRASHKVSYVYKQKLNLSILTMMSATFLTQVMIQNVANTEMSIFDHDQLHFWREKQSKYPNINVMMIVN